MEWIDMDAFDGVAVADVDQMLDKFIQMCTQGVVYEPWVQYAMPGVDAGPPRQHPAGIRKTTVLYRGSVRDTSIPQPDGPPLEVWVFGGSTAFGWDVADRWTVADALWDELPEEEQRLRKAAPHSRHQLRARPVLLDAGSGALSAPAEVRTTL